MKYQIRGCAGAFWISYRRDKNSPEIRVNIRGAIEWPDRESAEKALEEAYWRAVRAGALSEAREFDETSWNNLARRKERGE